MENLETLTTEKLKLLAAYEAPLCLTLIMPCIMSGDQQQQNRVRFKNLIQEAEDKLKKVGQREEDIKMLLDPLEEFLNLKDFWKTQSQGLLVCVAEGFQEMYSLPFSVDVNAIVDRHFYLRQIIPHMQEPGKTAIFLLCMNNPMLLFANGPDGRFKTVIPPKQIRSFENYMQTYDTEESLQFRSQGYSGGSRATSAGYHSQGRSGDAAVEKTHLKEYFKQLESWVSKVSQRRRCSEIFLVTESHLEGLYKSVAHKGHPRLHKLAQKNPASEKPEIWLAHARRLLKEGFQRECERTLSVFERLKKKHESSVEENIPDIVRAAHNQRIDTLMLSDASQDYYWGRFDPETSTVQRQKQDESVTGPGDELVNLAVIKTFLNGGKILPLPAHQGDGSPGYPDYAALYRW